MTPIRVLMLGPALDAPGGVAVVARRLLDAPPAGVDLRHLATSGEGSRAQKLWIAARASRSILAESPPDLAHVHLAGGPSILRKAALVVLLRSRSVPVVLHCHFAGVAAFERPGPLRAALVAMSGAAARVVALSQAQARLLRPLCGDRLVLVPNGVPTDRFHPLGPAGRPPQILYLGGGEERKGGAELAAALGSLPQGSFRARVAGSGSDLLREALGDLPGVEIEGRLDRDRCLSALKDADILALPSHAEGLPLALLEAMSCGLACVATDLDGMADALEDGRTGLLVPPRDPLALARALGRLLEDADLRQRLGAAARREVLARFDQRTAAASLARLWREVVGQCSVRA